MPWMPKLWNEKVPQAYYCLAAVFFVLLPEWHECVIATESCTIRMTFIISPSYLKYKPRPFVFTIILTERIIFFQFIFFFIGEDNIVVRMSFF